MTRQFANWDCGVCGADNAFPEDPEAYLEQGFSCCKCRAGYSIGGYRESRSGVLTFLQFEGPKLIRRGWAK